MSKFCPEDKCKLEFSTSDIDIHGLYTHIFKGACPVCGRVYSDFFTASYVVLNGTKFHYLDGVSDEARNQMNDEVHLKNKVKKEKHETDI